MQRTPFIILVLIVGCNQAPSPRASDVPTTEANPNLREGKSIPAFSSSSEGVRPKSTAPTVPIQAKDDASRLDELVGHWQAGAMSLKIERGGKGTFVWGFSRGDNFAEPAGDLGVQVQDGKILISMSPSVFGETLDYRFVATLSEDKTTLVLEETNNHSKPKTLKKLPSTLPDPSRANSRKERIAAALKLCGNTYDSLEVSYPAGERGNDFDPVRIEEIARAVLFEKGTGELAEKFPLAAKNVAAVAPKGRFQLRLVGERSPALKDIQRLLGPEESAEDGRLQDEDPRFKVPRFLSIKWYKWGWCCFGVSDDGRVVALRAECSAV